MILQNILLQKEANYTFTGFRISLLWLILFSAVAGPQAARAQSVLPHVAAGGGFLTGFYVVNTRNQAGSYSISFRDDAGKALTLSLSGIGSRTTISDTLPANGSKYYEADSPSGALVTGSGTITADAGVRIQALFRRSSLGANYSEAAVPATAGANQFAVPFDDSFSAENGAQIYTGLALVNMDSLQAARVTCTARDAQGVVIPNAVSVPVINALGHWAGYLFSALAQKRGTLNCVSNTKVGAVALRFVANSMSTLAVVENSGQTEGGRRMIPHFAAGGGFKTAFYVVNTANQTASYKLNFYDDNGQPATLSITGRGSVDHFDDTLPAYTSKYFEADSPTGRLVSGWANVAREPSITAQAVFMRRDSAGNYSEASILAVSGGSEFLVPFDDTSVNGTQIYTGLALANTDVRDGHVNCTARDAQGALIPNAITVPMMAAGSHWSGYLFPALLNKRGTLVCDSDIEVTPVALRFVGNAMSSLPTIVSSSTAGPAPNPEPSSGLIQFHDRNGKFSFQYPANFSILFNGPDPVNTGMTLVRLASTDGSQKLEVRYMPHPTGWEGATSFGDRIEQEFNRTQMQAIFLDSHLGNDTTESGATFMQIFTNNLRDRNSQVIGTSIWSHFDYADIVFGYDTSKASSSARDTVFRTLEFATAPSLIGRWYSSALEVYFNPDGTLLFDDIMGRYTAADGVLDFTRAINGQMLRSHCIYSVTAAHLSLNCGADGTALLLAQPDYDNFGILH